MKQHMSWLCLMFLMAAPAGAQPIDASKGVTSCDMQLAFRGQVDAACGRQADSAPLGPKRSIGIGDIRGVKIDPGPAQAPAGNAGGLVENRPRGITLPSVTFASGSARLSPSARPNLEKIGDFLARNPDIRLEIGGHTDAAGTEEANKVLSQRRANAVMTILVSRGASETQFLPVGYGEERLVPDEPCVSEKQRRVELFVVGTNPWSSSADTLRFCD
ncbi:hypothetical protein CHU95_10845 [Niveispirillum lacus]|uniref:OmpA-like domain-containing protein n=1 Tax=Niveispirillum lacus TaxID=1981099 RepID=A0A255YZ38_9PROT|nr:OmpA family protein [Niveispirillum lacus]OYQ34513.1 hypothetical protein CHU95_10845 [Niveispirillum lacus]